MEIYKDILDRLKEEYSSGATYQKMAGDKNVSYSYLRGLMNGINSPDKISLGVLFKLFPHAQINLNAGEHVNGNAMTGNGPAIVGHHNHVTANGSENSAETFRSKAIAAMIDLDIPADALREVLKTLKDLQV